MSDLTDHDFLYDIKQKRVDIRMGIDICSLTLKRQVDQIVLVSGDADFVPAAKLARREGVDFVLDPMWSNIGLDLTEHIDGLRSTCPGRRARRRRSPKPLRKRPSPCRQAPPSDDLMKRKSHCDV